MNKFIRIITFAVGIAYCLASVSCSTQHLYTQDDMAGFYYAIKSPPYSYDRHYDVNKDAYLGGDTGNYPFTYYVYHRLIMESLRLLKNGTFFCSDHPFYTVAKGTWAIKERDTLVLNFEQVPEDDKKCLARSYEEYYLFPNEGTRKLKIIGKNKLRFECPKFKAPDNDKEVTIYERQKVIRL